MNRLIFLFNPALVSRTSVLAIHARDRIKGANLFPLNRYRSAEQRVYAQTVVCDFDSIEESLCY
jgi:hypothetical protein